MLTICAFLARDGSLKIDLWILKCQKQLHKIGGSLKNKDPARTKSQRGQRLQISQKSTPQIEEITFYCIFILQFQKSGGSETSNLPKIDPSNPKVHFLLHFHIKISKSQGGQLTPLTPCSRGPCNYPNFFKTHDYPALISSLALASLKLQFSNMSGQCVLTVCHISIFCLVFSKLNLHPLRNIRMKLSSKSNPNYQSWSLKHF